MSLAAELPHPDIARAMNIPAANTNTFPTIKPYILLIGFSHIKRRDLTGFQQVTSLSRAAFTNVHKGFATPQTSLSSRAEKLHIPQSLSAPPTVRQLIILLYPRGRKSQGKSDSRPQSPPNGFPEGTRIEHSPGAGGLERSRTTHVMNPDNPLFRRKLRQPGRDTPLTADSAIAGNFFVKIKKHCFYWTSVVS